MNDSTPTHYARNIRATFEAKLKTWQRHTVYTVNGQSHFYETKAFESWMEQTEESEGHTNTQLLLNDLDDKFFRYHITPIKDRQIHDRSYRSVRVFGILLSLGKGELIEIFRTTGIVDRTLGSSEFLPSLREKMEQSKVPSADTIIENFEKVKWTFYPAELNWNMEGNFERGQYILPFCRRVVVNSKGGQASVVQVAVQKEFAPEEWHKVLPNALYEDDKFGKCYRIAVKIFADERRTVGNAEKEALASLFSESGQDESLSDKPLVRYLGYFSHSEELNGQTRKTYNLLLEYGDLDLDEYFAVTEPPTGYEEIVSFWVSLFRVAEALKEVHQFSYSKHHQYYGWHGDVKPDNILVVNGVFKLADFGFAKLKRINEKQPEEPTHTLEGGTRTFGPPEGIKGEVTQKIDIWSFGTVLLIAATWVVLGNKGLAQFEFLRKLAIETLRRWNPNRTNLPSVDDAFHNGEILLPDIKEWMDILRERRRHRDTMTGLVLDLVENSMLKESSERIVSNDLCDRLTDLQILAEIHRMRMIHNGEIKRPEKIRGLVVDQALLAYEHSFGIDTDKLTVKVEAGVDTELSQGTHTDRNTAHAVIPLRRSIRNSTRVGKSHILHHLPTYIPPPSHREDILKKEKQNRGIDTPTLHEHHVEAVSVEIRGEDIIRGVGRPEYPPLKSHAQENNASVTGQDHYPMREPFKPAASPRDELSHRSTAHGQPYRVSERTDIRHMNLESGTNRQVPHITVSPSQNPSTPDPQTIQNPSLLKPKIARRPSSNRTERNDCFVGLPPVLRRDSGDRSADSIVQHRRDTFPPTIDLPPVENPRPSSSSPPQPPTGNPAGTGPTLALQSTAKEPDKLGADFFQRPRSTSPSLSLNVPPVLRGLDYDIFNTRWELEGKKPKTRKDKLSSSFSRLEPDEHLKRLIKNRDVVFVVDNGSSMHDFRYVATFVIETLAEKLRGIDKDGLDLKFTIGEGDYDVTNAKKDAPGKFKSAMLRAWPTPNPNQTEKTDMCRKLGQIFTEYRDSQKKQTTLIIITDGVWDGLLEKDAAGKVKPDRLERQIVKFMEHVQKFKPHEERWFTIQFLQLGENQDSTERLRRYDDDLETIYKKYKFPDVIDHVHWTGSVDKMILGSMREFEDKNPNLNGAPDNLLQTPPPNINQLLRQYYDECKRNGTVDLTRRLSFK